MKVEIKIPKMGESIVEATIGPIMKPSGSMVNGDEEILEIETEKVNQVLSAPAKGRVELKVKSGDTVRVEQVIGFIDTEGVGQTVSSTPPPVEEISKNRELAHAKIPIDEPLEVTPPPRSSAFETRKKMSKVRRVIAARLVQVKNETAMLSTFNEVDMSAIMALRTHYREAFEKKHGVRLGFMSFFIKACVSALQEFPDINARIDGDEIVYQHFYDIGIAVSSEKGLFVPVLRKADQLSYAELEKALKHYAEKARAQTISIDEMQGGTFTISNGGVYGSMLSTPILNPPQSGILGMHNIQKRAVVMEDQIVIRPMMYLALSYDHRIVDGKDSISFLIHVKKKLETPETFLLDL
ncbi:MAG: hypothetical protein ACD_17C00509G0002 [uncultured bacterium]|nr:MAG: hypothetical protein ACD_17C00509G0002 [uncultured bacterium]OGN56202.1 MAG: 2-oxoglutarate dehydrogenase [Chlamydiae bacterium RIFCSPHIGHO2_01_FULL_44_39]OGN60675.1 MAG: 2-oxoglutarate dehydrogenase [Chlamydiae bacterium RIFCSPHIGHO2_12_FULL_44_59]OGN66935.1 MAG: 2-oxoglutarate dehydrogenase [Chlamydiae bacterium RIFCSPLOWO2_01_FULL_44_52]OGN67487.1 MAG: 2-oxoglutarate dehydrogenase [Chlamydiae bacterium RIFCSPLOWO2_02_FULL_45_22]OGN71188.1 MAG: 2-oxoglutarate dehydrogenase [Chlamydia